MKCLANTLDHQSEEAVRPRAPIYFIYTEVCIDIDRRNAMLVSRVACLGRLRHQPRGYSGPLSRHMLAYHSIISAIQASLRDTLEVALASMFLEGEVERDRKDFMDLSLAYALSPNHINERFTHANHQTTLLRREILRLGYRDESLS